jgi:predicted nucleic acid-binding Zn ribbon protein
MASHVKRKNELSLAEAIGHLIDGAGMRERMDELDIASWWDEVAGGMVARHTTSIRLRGGRLLVRVDSAPLRHELTFLREQIKERLNERAGRILVDAVVLE